ncbi:MAG: hypothetical protein DUD27_09320 [Lachnospiraceae bacterium]|nr:MAG: hypothetical protein DUD27_09320 [Lachnospiraceae bacterium]
MRFTLQKHRASQMMMARSLTASWDRQQRLNPDRSHCLLHPRILKLPAKRNLQPLLKRPALSTASQLKQAPARLTAAQLHQPKRAPGHHRANQRQPV